MLRSSWTLRQWADHYCASNKTLKEFVYTKTVYGWDLGNLRQKIRNLIAFRYISTQDLRRVPNTLG
ncbi:hypothetical protein FA95DRAFT_1553158 [Auriscalpium vulgare]|uniref:Uncharacterized protein n=1 Tax=Auriscalpium vulgare TaxID=40419 RepID=A0ACB8SAD1_9AGAM|nr:hypothetical protein FA95DRAFT_1553158 [Auriscalpium vulgare]